MSKFTEEELNEDIDFLLRRSMKAGHLGCDGDRDVGISSNSLVRKAYCPISVTEMPRDMFDLLACERAFNSLPKHRKTKAVIDALDAQREHVSST